MRVPLRLVPLLPLMLVACGGDARPFDVEANTAAVVVDGTDAYSIVFESAPTCTASETYACGSVRRWSRAGGGSVVLTRANGIGAWLAADADGLYFTTSTGWNTGEAEQGPTSRTATTIARIPKTGGPVTTLATLPGAVVRGLVVRGGRVLFLADSADQKGGGEVAAVPTGGGDVSVLAPVIGRGEHLVADDTSAYWAERSFKGGTSEGFTISSLPLAAGGKPTVFAEGGEGWVEGMALDADTLWVTNHGPIPTPPGADPKGGTVTAYARTDGAPRTIASGLTAVGAIAVDDARVVYLVWGSAAPNPAQPKGEVRAAPKAGGAASVTLLRSYDGLSVAADGAGVCVAQMFDAQVTCVPR